MFVSPFLFNPFLLLLLFLKYFPDTYAPSPKWFEWRKYMVELLMGQYFSISFPLVSILCPGVSIRLCACVWKGEFDAFANRC